MTSPIVRRARALGALTAVLRDDPDAPLPADADGWGAFLELAAEHGLLPAVYVALQPTGRVDLSASVARALELAAPPGRAVPEVVLRRAYDRNAARVARLLDAGIELLRRFADDGVRAVPLKGLHSLLAGTWPDGAARTMVDLDVLVDADRAEPAYAALLAAGYEEHPDPVGEHADHHLPMLRHGEVTVELHTELLVSRWRGLAPATEVLDRATFRSTPGGTLLLADGVDTLVHLVAHAQLQEETYALLGLPLRALHETARHQLSAAELAAARARFERSGVVRVFDAHMDAARRLFGAAVPSHSAAWRSGLHTRLAEAGVAAPPLAAGWTYAVRFPRSFSAARMVDEFGPGTGAAWLWKARARHAARRVTVRLDRRGR